ncbi:uncharacterized protein LOC135356510 [Latimeria chalumnae]|uniref:uncharacterized protein LOC135356510 n=1 Tax=Latimeria chalumnae TaxID=7897 RepID=UPI00313F1E6C
MGIARRRRRRFYRGDERLKMGEPIWGRLPRRRNKHLHKKKLQRQGQFLVPIKRLALMDSLKICRLEERDMVTRSVLLNARSICNKTAIIFDFLSKDIDLALITETWLDDCAAPVLAAAIPPGFSVIHCPQLHWRGEGLAICFRSCLKCTRTPWKETSSFEYMIALCEARVNYKILLIYRPPRWNADFLNELSELISFLAVESPNLIVVGDFNARMDAPSDNLARELAHLMQAFGFTQFVNTATHEGGHVLDLVFSMGIAVTNLRVIPVAWSDHSLVHFDVGVIPSPYSSLRTYSFRPKHLLDPNKFREMPLSSDSLSSKGQGIISLVDNYNLVLSINIDLLAPLRTQVERPSYRAPWFAGALKLMKVSGRRLEHRWRVSRSDEDRLIFWQWLINYQSSILEAKSFFASVIDLEKNKPAALFRIVNNLVNPSCLRPRENFSQNCNDFLSFFSNKVELIRAEIISDSSRCGDDFSLHDEATSQALWCSFDPVSKAHVIRVIWSLKATTCDFDPCPSWHS